MKIRMLSIIAATLILAMSVQSAEAKGEAKAKERDQKAKLAQEKKEQQEKLKAMSPEERRIFIVKTAFSAEIAPWLEVRKIALEEKASKTVAAIDKIIAAKEEALQKKISPAKKAKEAEPKKAKDEGKAKAAGKGKGKSAGSK